MNPLIRQPNARRRHHIRAQAPSPRTSDDGVVSLRLYDPIDSWGEFWGVSAREFVQVLDEVPADTTEIQLLINSPGGEVWEGLAILNALRAHPARVVAVVEGIAASAASFIATGVDELAMARNSELFVHRAWAMAIGNAEDLERVARDLTHEDRNLASIYAAKAGTDVETWLTAMGEETWYSATEAVELGLADRVLEQDGAPAATAARARFDLSALSSRHGADDSPAIASATNSSSTDPRRSPMAFTDDQLTELREKLGVAADADEQTILGALDEALAERADDEEPAPVPASAALPEGVTTIDASLLADLQARAARGDEARSQQETDNRNALVRAAVQDGRIPPARAEHWQTLLASDPGSADVLASLAANTVPIEARGRDDAPSTNPDDDALYSKLYGQKASA